MGICPEVFGGGGAGFERFEGPDNHFRVRSEIDKRPSNQNNDFIPNMAQKQVKACQSKTEANEVMCETRQIKSIKLEPTLKWYKIEIHDYLCETAGLTHDTPYNNRCPNLIKPRPANINSKYPEIVGFAAKYHTIKSVN